MSWKEIESYNVVYTVPGESDRSAMPVGDGELCASAWMDTTGKLFFYFGRTDCLGENDVTMKHGIVEIETVPGFLSNGGYCQSLILKEGRIEIESALGKILIYIEKQNHTIYVTGEFNREMTVRARFRTWRILENDNPRTPWNIASSVQADTVEYGQQICFYHKNGKNGIRELAKLQGIDDYSVIPDFLTNRIFGGIMEMSRPKLTDGCLQTTGTHMEVRITTLSGQYEDEKQWKKELSLLQQKNKPAETALRDTINQWTDFWERSYIFVSGDKSQKAMCTEEVLKRAEEPMECNDVPSKVTQAYLLTKYMFACCKDGNFPIFYNGLLFNLAPGNGEHLEVPTFAGTFTSKPLKEADEEFNPDERSWAIEHLWQNLRLPYYTMLQTGDFESLKRMFCYYLRFQKLNEERAKAYYGAEGIHNVEMTLSCGLMSAEIYGIDRSDKHPGEADNHWGGSIQISPGLELLNLMLEYCRYTQDTVFLKEEVTEYARKTFRYIETRFGRDEDGKIFLTDINCVETYFHTDNPITIIAGMHSTLRKLLNMDISKDDKRYFQQILNITPSLPMCEKEGKKVLLPAQNYKEERQNIELPELYAVYPFELYTHLDEDAQIAVDTFWDLMERYDFRKPHIIGMPPGTPSYSGWHYIGDTAALLGMKELCREILEKNAALKNPGNRFPAMWGAVHDAVPDVDHGANIMNQLQLMLVQEREGKISILPAFPEEWNVKFKLFISGNRVVEFEYENGIRKKYEIYTLKMAEEK